VIPLAGGAVQKLISRFEKIISLALENNCQICYLLLDRPDFSVQKRGFLKTNRDLNPVFLKGTTMGEQNP